MVQSPQCNMIVKQYMIPNTHAHTHTEEYTQNMQNMTWFNYQTYAYVFF